MKLIEAAKKLRVHPITLARKARTGKIKATKHYYYMVTALNDVGETEGSNEIEVAVNKEREVWATYDFKTKW